MAVEVSLKVTKWISPEKMIIIIVWVLRRTCGPRTKTALIELAQKSSVDRNLFKNVNEGNRPDYINPEIELAKKLGIP